MKFTIDKISSSARLCQLEIGEKCVTSPMCMLYTRAGSVPHLTPDISEQIAHLPGVIQMPLTLLSEYYENVAAFGKGLKKFTANERYLLYTSVQDPAVKVPPGYNDKTGVSVWGRGGRIKLTVEEHTKIQEAFQPDMYQALCDSDTDKDSSKKRVKKSVDKTLDFLDECLRRQKESKVLCDSSIFGVIQGGHILEERIRSAKETAKRPVEGFCVDGFHTYGPETESFNYCDIKDIITQSLGELPASKPRILGGIMAPDQVLHVIEMGIDIVDSSYPYIVTERGHALVFDYILREEQTDGVREINLKEKKYFEDFLPILSTCECYTCKTHTRSYVQHLLNTSELLGSILLMIHNCHHYFQFFSAIRRSIQNDTFTQYKQFIMDATKS